MAQEQIARKYSRRLDEGEAAAYLGISRSGLNKLRRNGSDAPPHIRIKSKILYDTLSLDRWMDAHQVGGA
jgi:hypothetical protein